MAYSICKECERFFEKNGSSLCRSCYTKDQEQYRRVREFVATHRGVTALDVINATGVSLKTVRRYVEEGMLEYTSDIPSIERVLEIKDRR